MANSFNIKTIQDLEQKFEKDTNFKHLDLSPEKTKILYIKPNVQEEIFNLFKEDMSLINNIVLVDRNSNLIDKNVSKEPGKLIKTQFNKFIEQSENNKIIFITNNEEKIFRILLPHQKIYEMVLGKDIETQYSNNNVFTSTKEIMLISYEDEENTLEFETTLTPGTIKAESLTFHDNQDTYYLPLDGSEQMLIGDIKRVFEQVGEPFPADILV